MRVISILVAFVIILAVFFFIFHKSDEVKIESVLNTFTEAYNEKDIEKMITCLDPKTQKMFDGVFGIASSLAGFNVSDILNIGSYFASEYADDMPLEIKVLNVRLINKNKAEVDAIFILGNEHENITIPMAKKDASFFEDFFSNNWYINEKVNLY